MELVLALVLAVAGVILIQRSRSGLDASEPEITDLEDGVELVLPRARRRRYAGGVLLLAAAIGMVSARLRDGSDDPTGSWALVAAAGVLAALFGVQVWTRGTGRLRLTSVGLRSKPPLGLTRGVTWDRVHGVAAERRRVLVVDDRGGKVWVNEVPGWGAERTERLVERLSRGQGRNRLSARELRRT